MKFDGIKLGSAPLQFSNIATDFSAGQQSVVSIYPMYNVQYTIHITQCNNTQCAVQSVQYAVYSTQCIVHNTQYTMCNTQCTMYSTQYTVHDLTIHNVQYKVYNVQCTVHNVQYTMCNTQCTMCSTL